MSVVYHCTILAQSRSLVCCTFALGLALSILLMLLGWNPKRAAAQCTT